MVLVAAPIVLTDLPRILETLAAASLPSVSALLNTNLSFS